MQKNKVYSYLLYQSIGMALSSMTGVLGTVPLMLIRKEYGRFIFLSLNLAIALGLFFTKNLALWLPYVICTLLVFVYYEFRKKGYIKAGAAAVATVFLLISIGFYIWGDLQKINHIAWLKESVESFAKLVTNSSQGIKIDVASLVKQLPSILITLLSVAMWLGVLFERRFSAATRDVLPLRDPFLNIKLPDYFVWVAILSLLLSYVKIPAPLVQEVALNTLNIILLLYFFQGLSIVAFAFVTFKVGPLLRAILYVIFVTQLFLFVSIFGILDFWLNLREKISNKSSKEDTRGEL